MDEILLSRIRKEAYEQGYQDGKVEGYNLIVAKQIKRKQGKWIAPATEQIYRCSVCEEYTTLEVPRLFYHYCPNCGAEMEVTLCSQ